MTKIFTIIAMFTAVSFSAFAGGSRRPVTDFTGSYELVRGQSIEDADGTLWSCPSSMVAISNESVNGKEEVVARTLSFRASQSASADLLPSFEGVNLGEARSGFYFWSSFTDKKALVYEEGREMYQPGRPGGPNNPGTPPRNDRFVTYRYVMKIEKNSSVTLSTTESRNSCEYSKLN